MFRGSFKRIANGDWGLQVKYRSLLEGQVEHKVLRQSIQGSKDSIEDGLSLYLSLPVVYNVWLWGLKSE